MADKKEINMYLAKTSNDILIDIGELNVDETEDNFILEVYEYEYNSEGKISGLKKKHFFAEETTEESVEYYFNVYADLAADEDSQIKINYVDGSLFDIEEDDECVP